MTGRGQTKRKKTTTECPQLTGADGRLGDAGRVCGHWLLQAVSRANAIASQEPVLRRVGVAGAKIEKEVPEGCNHVASPLRRRRLPGQNG